MKRRKIPILRLPYTAEDIDFIRNGVAEVLQSGYLTMGEKVARFEEEFAKFAGSRYAVATSSGTSSLEIILRSIGVQDSTVVMPSNTFMASATSVVHAGGKVVFADCQRENLQLDPADLKKKIRKDTKVVMLVHIGGVISPHLDEIKEICDRHGIYLLEDAAHAHGATIDGRKAGTLGIAGSFSFYPTKVLTTAEGGMITTDDEAIYRQAITLRDHGKPDHRLNVHTEFGYNWRFSELHALLGLRQMQKADEILAERRRIAALYDEKLPAVKRIRPLRIPANIESSYYKYIAFLDEGLDRDAVKKELNNRFDIQLTGEVYAQPLHLQPVFNKYPWALANDPADTFPATEHVSQHHVCLPIYPGLNEEDIDYIVDSIKKVLA